MCVSAAAWILPAQQKQVPPQNQVSKNQTQIKIPPKTILFPSGRGDVTFTHQKHFERVGGKCDTCHPKVFPQAREPINYKKASHRAAEASYTSCAHCHAVGATAFAADSNCIKCHAMPSYK